MGGRCTCSYLTIPSAVVKFKPDPSSAHPPSADGCAPLALGGIELLKSKGGMGGMPGADVAPLLLPPALELVVSVTSAKKARLGAELLLLLLLVGSFTTGFCRLQHTHESCNTHMTGLTLGFNCVVPAACCLKQKAHTTS